MIQMTNILMTYMSKNKSIPQDAESIMQYFLMMGYTRYQVAGTIGNAVKKGLISVAGKQYCNSRNKMVHTFI